MKALKQIWILFLAISINLLQAQSNSYRISGLVKSEQNQNVEFGNVIALSIKDSALIKGGPFQDGTFNLGPLNNDSILLKVTSVGYSDFFRII
ncbi:MAG TPA: hypothetical protein PLC65_12255, partial [Bacteroidia bacterium]|nr:hypothetical protein [Bacteroidia bacterium]